MNKLILPLALCAALPVAAAELTDVAALDPGSAAIVLLGEVHDNPHHHENQRAALVALKPAAVVFEMLTPEQAAIANTADRSDAAALEKELTGKTAAGRISRCTSR